MSDNWEKATYAIGMFSKVMVSLLWVVGGLIAVSLGIWQALFIVIPYLAYLWVFGGRWLIY